MSIQKNVITLHYSKTSALHFLFDTPSSILSGSIPISIVSASLVHVETLTISLSRGYSIYLRFVLYGNKDVLIPFLDNAPL